MKRSRGGMLGICAGIFCFLLGTVQAQDAWLSWDDTRLRNQPQEYRSWVQAQLRSGANRQYSLGNLLVQAGRADWMLGEYDQANEYFLEALSWAQVYKDTAINILSWQGLASVAWRYSDYEEALRYQLNAMNLLRGYERPRLAGPAWLWLGIIYADLNLYEEALGYYRQALDIATATSDTLLGAKVWNWIGRAHRKQEQYDSARYAHAASITGFRALNDSLGISDYLNNVGSIFRREGRHDTALSYFFRALDIQARIHDLEGLADGYNDIGTTYSQMGRYDDAFTYLQKGLEVADSISLRDDVRYAYASLAATYDSLGNFQEALRYYRMEQEIAELILQEEVQRRLDMLDILNENQAQKEEIMSLQLAEANRKVEIRQQKEIAIGIGAAVLIVFGVGVWRIRTRRAQARELARKNTLIEGEKQRAEALLLNILPESIAEELKSAGKAAARELDHVTVMFVDFVGFSRYAAGRSPREVVQNLQVCFEAFDRIVAEYGLEKIKTIGDAYMCAAGVPQPFPDQACQAVRAALRMQQFMKAWQAEQEALGEPAFRARIGLHTGPVVAGVVGLHKFTYDIWGDTVNIASRMESAGEPGRVNISRTTYEQVKHYFICRPRGKVEVKHLGEIEMYYADWAI